MRNLALLLAAHMRSRWNNLRTSGRRIATLVLLAVFAFWFISLLATLSHGVFAVLASQNAVLVIESLTAASFTAAFILALLSSVAYTFNSLYEARDLRLLLSSPLAPTTVFSYKFLLSFLDIAGVVLLFFGPVLASLGLVFSASPLYYILAFLGLLLFTLLPLGLGYLLSIVVLRLLPPRRSKEILAVIGSLTGLMIWAGMQYMQTMVPRSPDPLVLNSLTGHISFLSYWPPGWAAGLAVNLALGNMSSALLLLLLLAALSLALTILCLTAVQTLYLSGWANSHAIPHKTKVSHPVREAPLFNFLPAVLAGVMSKEIKTLQRNLQELTQWVLPVVIIAFFVWQSSRRPPMDAQGAQFFDTMNLIVIAFITSLMASSISSRSLPREGRCIQLFVLSPVDLKQVLLGKFFIAYLPALILAEAALLFIILFTGKSPGWFGFPALALVMPSFTALGLSMGAFSGRYNSTNPKKMLSAGGALLLQLFSLLLLGVYAALAALISYLAGLGAGVTAYVGGLLILLLVSLGITQLSLTLAADHLSGKEWALKFTGSE